MDAALSANKQVVLRFVEEVVNGRDFARLDELAAEGLAPELRAAFEAFHVAFPDWRQDIVELVEENDTVVARFRCTGTQQAPWQGLAATGRRMDVDEVAFIRMSDGRISGMWALEDTWTRMRQLAGDHVSAGELGALG